MTASDFAKALQKTDEIELTVTGRVSGKKSTRSVWFVLEGKTLYLLPVQGSDSEWYEHVLKHPMVTLAVEGAKWTGKTVPITDPAKVHDVVERFRTKYGAGEVKKYYTKLDVAVKVPLK
jgi:hypothetical protein